MQKQAFKFFNLILIIIFAVSSAFLGASKSVDDGGVYSINSAEDLIAFAESVNNGKTYSGQTVNQLCDIDLDGIEFTPIGSFGSGNYFYGTYNGNGYTISNLHIATLDNSANNGLFGQLGGTVMNLNLNGYIYGNCCGSFASHSASFGAKIINCHSSVVFSANRSGGIADNFNGYITGCSYFSAEQSNYIVSYNAISVKYCCSNNDEPLPETYTGEAENNAAVTSADELESLVNGNLAGTAAASGISLDSLTKYGVTQTGGFFDSLTNYPANTLKQYFYHIAAVIAIIASVAVIAATLVYQKRKNKNNENK